MTDVTEAEGAAPKKARAKKKHADPVARLRAAAWQFLAGRRAAAAAAAAKRTSRKPPIDPIAAFRRASWAELHAPKKPAVVVPKGPEPLGEVARAHLKAVLEALVFAAEQPASLHELSKSAQADRRVVKVLLAELVEEYRHRGFRLDEIAGGFVFRTSPAYAPFVREQVAKKPVRMTRAQVETLAIVAYRQPVTRPEVDDVRGVDSGATLKTLLERDLVRILGKKDEPGRPMIYGTTNVFLNFFGLKALGDLPTLREFTELSDESRRTFERELGEEAPDHHAPSPEGFAGAAARGLMGGEGDLRQAEVEIVPDSFSYDASGEFAASSDDEDRANEDRANEDGANDEDAVEEAAPRAETAEAPTDGAEEAPAAEEAAADVSSDEDDDDDDDDDDDEDWDEDEDDDDDEKDDEET